MGKLDRLELENFKSYYGKQTVGPFDNFSCIVGPNGAGKSNMMDAISFVLGVQSKHLRSVHLKDLIYRKDPNSPPARKAQVKLFYVLSSNESIGNYSPGSTIVFSRSILASGVSTYRLDEKDVTFEAYEKVLQSLGVLVKVRNFLVFQGDVESLASKSPMDLTRYLEQISGSDQYKSDYDHLFKQHQESEDVALALLQKKKLLSSQCREVKAQKDEADWFKDRSDSLRENKTELVLLKLWRVREDIRLSIRRRFELQQERAVLKKKDAEMNKEILTTKKELGRLTRDSLHFEKEISEQSTLLGQITPELKEAEGKIKSYEKTLAELQVSQERMRSDFQRRSESLAQLDASIADLQQQEDQLQLEQERHLLSKPKGREGKERQQQQESGEESSANVLDYRSNAELLQEYSRLREEASGRTLHLKSQDLRLEQELTSIDFRRQRLKHQQTSLQSELEKDVFPREKEYEKRLERLKEAQEKYLEEQRDNIQQRERFTKELNEGLEAIEQGQQEISELQLKIKEFGEERKRSQHEIRLKEGLEGLKRLFPGVHGPLFEVIRPIQAQYGTAVSIALGKSLEAVVVDNAEVCHDCDVI